MELIGTTAIVTGASQGIGYTVADYLIAHGADVIITSRNQIELDAAGASLTAAHDGRRALAIVADVSKSDDIDRLFDTAEAELGPITIVVNNAGNSTLVDGGTHLRGLPDYVDYLLPHQN